MERLLKLARRRTKTLPVIIVVVAAAAAAGARALVGSHATAARLAASQAADEHAGVRGRPRGSRDHDMTSEVITIYPTGFGTTELTRPKGKFLLLINDRSGLEALDIRLLRENGDGEREARTGRNQPRWSGLVNLQPGRYRLTEANHPEWSCLITITPN